ncbi:MAG: hypothetical protein R3304_03225 [Longimicrobiales bacterium]|nr:hypothetical protein [Longimicrobiales bacterium]
MTPTKDDRPAWIQAVEGYNRAGAVPRDEMWRGIVARIAAEEDHGEGVDDLARARARKRKQVSASGRRGLGLAVAAAAALVLGVGVGRMTAPTDTAPVAASTADVTAPRSGGLDLATREHLGRSGSLLTLVRADARDGRMDPAVAEWADGLLAQTRLLLDRRDGISPDTRELLLDLELVLAQVVGAAGPTPSGTEQADTETALTLTSLEEGRLLPRIEAALPHGAAGA